MNCHAGPGLGFFLLRHFLRVAPVQPGFPGPKLRRVELAHIFPLAVVAFVLAAVISVLVGHKRPEAALQSSRARSSRRWASCAREARCRSAAERSSSGGGRLRSSPLLVRSGSGATLCRAQSRGRVRARVGAGAYRAPDCAREIQGTSLPSVSQGFSKSSRRSAARRRRRGLRMPPLTTPILHPIAQCQDQSTNNVENCNSSSPTALRRP